MASFTITCKNQNDRTRIRGWVHEYGEDGVYVSFSGGKDSTVLLDIVRNRMGYENIPAVFVDTGLEYPEIREFVKTFDNVVWLKPKMNFRQVIEKYGYPFISKEVSRHVSDVRRLGSNCFAWKLFDGTNRENIFNKEQWKFLLDAPFEISNKCCNVMKKTPVHKYAKESGRHPITAQMASESLQRTVKWLQNGCNGFNLKEPISNPMSFWTEQDVLQYIYTNNIKICSVYGDIVPDEEKTDGIVGQMSLWGEDIPMYKTTGCNRTGCMLCGFGCHLEKSPNRFEMLKETHPGMYQLLDKVKNNGVTMREAIDWINEHGNLDIKY